MSDEEVTESLTSHIKNIPHFPASTCARHVYIFKKSDVEASEYVQEIFSNRDGEYKTYSNEEAYKFLLTWYVGGKNEKKFLQDTYNPKTVSIIFDVFANLVRYGMNETMIQNKLTDLAAQVAELKKEKAEEAKSGTKIKSNDDRIGWLNHESSMYRQLPNRISHSSIEGNLALSTLLEYTFQKLSEDAKIIFSAKQAETKEAKDSGGDSCWTENTRDLQLLRYMNTDKFNEVMLRRTNFFALKCNEIIEARRKKVSELSVTMLSRSSSCSFDITG